MPIYRVPNNDIWFPPVEEFEGDIVAVGGDLSIPRLLVAYSRGLFPWYNPGEEILWWCPNDRCVLYTDELKVSHGLRNAINRNTFHCTMDQAFEEVMIGCREPRRGDPATWVSDEFIAAYTELHHLGYAHSVEAWNGDKLAGGLYGVSLGRIFFGESMFARESNASKVAFHHLVTTLRQHDYTLIDCQVYNDHLGTLGARTIDRSDFLDELALCLEKPIIKGSWKDLAR